MANAAMEARRSGMESVFIVLGIFHFHAVFVFWVAVRQSLPRPRAMLSLATGCFPGESSGRIGVYSFLARLTRKPRRSCQSLIAGCFPGERRGTICKHAQFPLLDE